jgi:hypothetical protein
MPQDFCRTAKHYKLAKEADRILAKSGFFRKPVAASDMVQDALDALTGHMPPSDAVSPHGHLRATWTGTINRPDALV